MLGNKMVIALMLLCLHVESEVVGEPSMQLFWSVHKHLPWHDGSFSFSIESGPETGLRQHYLRGTHTHTHTQVSGGGIWLQEGKNQQSRQNEGMKETGAERS